MKIYFLSLLTAAALLVSSCSSGQSQSAETSLQAQAFAEKIKQLPDAPLIDVRTPEEFSKGYLPNAKNIDWNGDNFQSEIAKLDKSKPVFVYCLSGGRSSSAASQMRSDGFKEVYELDGGIMKWRAAGLPEATQTPGASTGMSKVQFDSLTNSDKIVLIDFYADWCAPCKKMKPYLDEISLTMKDSVAVVRINADDNQQLCKTLQIDGLPVLLVYKKGALTWRHNGFIAREEVLKQL